MQADRGRQVILQVFAISTVGPIETAGVDLIFRADAALGRVGVDIEPLRVEVIRHRLVAGVSQIAVVALRAVKGIRKLSAIGLGTRVAGPALGELQ